MSSRRLPCPDEDLLAGFSEGRLIGEAHTRIVQHLSECDACLAAVGGLGSEFATQRIGTVFRAGDLLAGRYEIVKFIDRGGMGEVYEASDRLLGARVALKTLLPEVADNPKGMAQIRREVQMARAITHPGICRVFDLGEHVPHGPGGNANGEVRRWFLTMEYLEGTTLGQRVLREGALDMKIVLPLARQLGGALQAAHAVGVIHRDFKSDNVMLVPTAQEPGARAIIMDFGLARGVASGVGQSSTGKAMVGSAAYMAPEQVLGQSVREAADVYAFGVVLFEASTGRLPFIGSNALATATQRLFEDPPPLRSLVPNIPHAFEKLVLRCLVRDPAERIGSMQAANDALAAIQDCGPQLHSIRTAGVAAPAPVRLSRFSVVALLAGALVVAGMVTLRSRPERLRPNPGGTVKALTSLQGISIFGPERATRARVPDVTETMIDEAASSPGSDSSTSRSRSGGGQAAAAAPSAATAGMAPRRRGSTRVASPTHALERPGSLVGPPVGTPALRPAVEPVDVARASGGGLGSPPATDGDHAPRPRSQSLIDGFENPFR